MTKLRTGFTLVSDDGKTESRIEINEDGRIFMTTTRVRELTLKELEKLMDFEEE